MLSLELEVSALDRIREEKAIFLKVLGRSFELHTIIGLLCAQILWDVSVVVWIFSFFGRKESIPGWMGNQLGT